MTTQFYQPKPPITPFRFSAKPELVSAFIAFIAVYGDLLKRILPPIAALMVIYGCCIITLGFMLTQKSRYIRSKKPPILIFFKILVLTYFLQFLTGFSTEILPAFQALIYICVPLLFVIVISQNYTNFDLYALARYVGIFMLPVHGVGLVQYFIDSNFFISKEYVETGGVIARNFISSAGSFNRLPAIFVSADRYAGVSSAQFLIAFVLLLKTEKRQQDFAFFMMISLLTASIGMLIGGARSRIIIIIFTLIIAAIAFLFKVVKNRYSRSNKKIVIKISLMIIFFLGISQLFESVRYHMNNIPVISMLSETIEKKDAQWRFTQALKISIPPDNLSFFGNGLGSGADGPSGEFAIRALWIESGLFWTIIILAGHFGILVYFAICLTRSVIAGNSLRAILLSGTGITWFIGLLTGFTSFFEISIALILFPTIAVAFMKRRSVYFT